jgi:DNA-binding NtrC family response regulator
VKRHDVQTIGENTLEIGSESIYLGDEAIRNFIGNLVDQTEAAERHPAQPSVLVVDDEKLIADTCSEILKTAGFHARSAYEVWSALDIVEEFRPDYLLTDVLMPRLNGVELAIAVRKMSPGTKILLFSGQAGISEILLQGHEQGYEFEVIAKPIHPLKLIEHLQNLESKG